MQRSCLGSLNQATSAVAHRHSRAAYGRRPSVRWALGDHELLGMTYGTWLKYWLGFFWRFARRTVTRGCDVRVWLSSERSAAPCVAKVAAALELIEWHDPQRFRRMQKDLTSIFIAGGFSGYGCYVPELKMCALNQLYVEPEDFTAAEMAMVIIHEATHARLHQAGIRIDRALSARIEHRCFTEELSFAARLPDTPILAREVLHLRHSVGGITTPEAWGSQQITALRDLGTPEWLVRSYGRIVLRAVT